jgi:hypothetical protein
MRKSIAQKQRYAKIVPPQNLSGNGGAARKRWPWLQMMPL